MEIDRQSLVGGQLYYKILKYAIWSMRFVRVMIRFKT